MERTLKEKLRGKRVLLFLILGVILVAGVLINRYIPNSERMDLMNQYYKIENKDGTLIVGNNNTETGIKIEEESLYLPLEAVNTYINERFYWDGENVLYTLPEETVTYIPGKKRYVTEEGTRYNQYVAVLVEKEQVWLEIRLVAQYTNITWTQFENPCRVWVWNKWDEELTYAQLKYDMKVRYRGGPKSSIVATVLKGDTVQILDNSVKYWTKVQTAEGIIGYVWSGAFDSTYTKIEKNDFEEIEYTSMSLEEEVVLMWHQELATSGIAELPSILERSKINVIAPSWFTIASESGNIVSRADKTYTDMAHEKGVQVWAMLDNINIDIDEKELLSSTQNRTNLIQNVMNVALESGIDGINLDFENIGKENAVDYIQFIREFSVACRKAGLILSVDNYVPINSNLYYNRTEQAKIVDYIIIMGYDEHWAGGEPGSTASYSFVENGIKRSLLEVPKEKLILAVPFYTRVWTITGDDTSSKAVGIKYIPSILEEWGIEVQWLEDEHQYYAEVSDGETTQKIWIEDVTSMAWKLNFVKEYELAGTAIWKANLESDDIWDLEWSVDE